MKDAIRTIVAAVVGAVVAIAVIIGQPALADQVDKAKAKKVTSAQIKNGTIKTKDLNAEVAGALAKAGTALQSVPDASVTTSKLANGSVTVPKLADGSVTGAKLADGSVSGAKIVDGSVSGGDLSANAVTSTKVVDHSLGADDIATFTGQVTVDVPNLNVNQCIPLFSLSAGQVVTGDFILVSAPAGVAGNIQITGRENADSTSAIDLVFCNVGGAPFDPPSATYHYAVIDNS